MRHIILLVTMSQNSLDMAVTRIKTGLEDLLQKERECFKQSTMVAEDAGSIVGFVGPEDERMSHEEKQERLQQIDVR